MQKNKSPSVAARAGKREARISSFYPSAPVSVKRVADTEMTCGLCHYYREGRRKFCGFTGETCRPESECHVDPMLPEFDAWLDAEDARLEGVTP